MKFTTPFKIASLLCVSLFFASLAHADCRTPMKEGMTYEDLQQGIQTCKLNTVEKLLPLLPPSYLSNFVLSHHSQSLQSSTPDSPRVIAFGKDAKLILAFNGDAHANRFKFIELIQFREATQTFEAREISFERGGPQFSEVNPRQCTACHQTDLRPNWEPAPLWASMYGSENDILVGDEANAFQSFLQKASGNSRYSALHLGSQFQPMNRKFTESVTKLNLARLARKISATPELSRLRYAFVGAVKCAQASNLEALQGFLPNSIASQFRIPIRGIFEATMGSNHSSFLDRYAFQKSLYPQLPNDPTVSALYAAAQGGDTGNATANDYSLSGMEWLFRNESQLSIGWSLQSVTEGVEYFSKLDSGPNEFVQALQNEFGTQLNPQAVNAVVSAQSESELSAACLAVQKFSTAL